MRDKDKLLEKAARLREKAEKLRSKAEAARDEVKGQILEQADEIRHQAEEMAAQAREIARVHAEAAHTDHDKVMHEKQALKEKQAAKMAMKRRSSDADDDDDDDGDSKGGDSNAYAKGYELHMKGQYKQAIELFQKSASQGNNTGASLYNIACGYARMGEKDKAFDYLKKAWAAGYRDRNHMKDDEDLKSLHGDPRFKEIAGGEEED
jgi:tetratricopeptide (TPR) repeat protein